MSNWPRWEIIYSPLALPAVPREVILSTCLHFLHRSPLQTAHSAVVLPALFQMMRIRHFCATTPPSGGLVISSHLRMISWDSAQLFCDWPKSQACASFWDYPAIGDVMPPASGAWSGSFACLTVLPRRNPPCCLFDLITLPVSRRERGWVTLRSTTSLPSFCIIYYTSASLYFIRSRSHPLRHAPPCGR